MKAGSAAATVSGCSGPLGWCQRVTGRRGGQDWPMDQFRNGPLTFPVRDSAPTGPANGETVVLLHGFPQVGSSWDALTPYLTGAGYRVLAPDQRGYAPTALAGGRRS